MEKKVVLAVEKSTNSKTGLVSATYAPIQSCPTSCPFINGGCYAQHGHCGIHLNRINKVAKELKKTRPVDIARIEAKEILNLSGTMPLRLHIVGDCKTPKAAEILASACKEYSKKAGQKVWTYTHAWKTIPREKWGEISVLASCESIDDAKYAMDRGYAASVVRAKPFDNNFDYQGVRMVGCPEMLKGIPCNRCNMCMDDKKLLANKRVICFFVHGAGKNKARDVLFNTQKEIVVSNKYLSDGLNHQKEFKKTLTNGNFWNN